MAAPYLAATSGQPPLAQHIDQFLISHATTYLYTGTQQGGQTTLGSGSAATNGLYLAQSFTAGSSFSLGRVVLTLALTGAPVPTTVSIQTSSAGAPSGTVLASTSLPPAMVPASAASVSIPLPCALTSGTTYWIVVAAAGDASDFYAWSKSNQTSGASTSATGSAWTAQAYGFSYALYDQSAVLPLVHAYDDAGARWSTLTSTAGQITALQEYTVGQSAVSPATSSVALSYSGSSLTSVAATGSTPAAPTWTAPHNGIIGDASATAGAASINQFLGTHGITPVYQGNQIWTPLYIYAATASPWNTPLLGTDVDQPFTLTGTSTGRIQAPILPVGNGADLLVSLWSDNGSGRPRSVVCQSRIPAAQITQLAAVSGIPTPSSDAPATELTGNPLAVAQHQVWGFSDQTITSYNYPAVTFVGISANPSSASYGGYIVIIGGVTGGNALTGVFTMQYTGDRELLPTLPQPSFPVGNDGSSSTCIALDSQGGGAVVVNSGGGTTFGGPPVASVYTSSLDTAAGRLSSWSLQTALPAAVQNHLMVAGPNGFVYSVGGINTAGTVQTTVNVGQVANGQIAGWSATTPLPIPVQLAFAAVTNGFLVVMGGANESLTAYANVWYAKIDESDGMLEAWIPGPSLSTPAFNGGTSPAFGTDFGILMDTNANSLTFGPAGPSSTWAQDLDGGSGALPGWFDLGDGTFVAYALAPNESLVGIAYDNLMPYLSVPLPASGLTNGATYHVTFQQQGGDLNDYLVMCMGPNIYSTSGPTALTSPAAAYAWTAQATGTAVAFGVFDNTPSPAPTLPWHLWSDHGARITTIVSATTPDQRPLGICEATRQAVALNANTGFESGIAPWTVTGGTGVQSSAHVYEGRYALQITPSGSAASVVAASEVMPCMPGQWCTADAKVWFTSAVTANYSTSIAWYTAASGGTQISTSASLVSVPAATWTGEAQTLQAPAGAYGFQIQATLSGTPSSSQVWYLDAARAHYTYTGPQNSTVTAIDYAGTYPWPWPGLGTRQLA